VATHDDSTVFKLVQKRTPFNNRHDQNASSDVARMYGANFPQSAVLGSRDEIDYTMGEVRERDIVVSSRQELLCWKVPHTEVLIGPIGDGECWGFCG